MPVANAYGMSEGVFSGFCGHTSHLPDDLCIIEPVDRQGDPVPPGETCARILATNLYNLTVPLIRYEVTDELTIREGACPCGCHFSRIEDPQGRSDDLFNFPDGTVIHPHVFRSTLGGEPRIIEYQVRQAPRGAAISIVAEGPVDLPTLSRQLETSPMNAGTQHPLSVTT